MPEKTTIIEMVSSYWPAALLAAVISSVGWLIRIVFTNQTKLTKLETEIAEREKARDREREDIRDLRDDVKDMRDSLIRFLTSHD